MRNKELTKAEEQVMLSLWKIQKGFLKDIVDQYADPKPAYTTVSTVIRVLVKKNFIGYTTFGKTNEYFPMISKSDYFSGQVKGMVSKAFNGSFSNFASFFADNDEIDLKELEEIKKVIEERITQKQKSSDE